MVARHVALACCRAAKIAATGTTFAATRFRRRAASGGGGAVAKGVSGLALSFGMAHKRARIALAGAARYAVRLLSCRARCVSANVLCALLFAPRTRDVCAPAARHLRALRTRRFVMFLLRALVAHGLRSRVNCCGASKAISGKMADKRQSITNGISGNMA